MLVADAKADRSISVAFSESPLPQEVRAINFPLELIMPRTSWGRGLQLPRLAIRRHFRIEAPAILRFRETVVAVGPFRTESRGIRHQARLRYAFRHKQNRRSTARSDAGGETSVPLVVLLEEPSKSETRVSFGEFGARGCAWFGTNWRVDVPCRYSPPPSPLPQIIRGEISRSG